MKQLILSTILILSLLSCKKENLNIISKSDIDGKYSGNCIVDTSKQCIIDNVYSNSTIYEITPYLATQDISNISIIVINKIIYIELTNCSFGNYSINEVPIKLETSFTNRNIKFISWILGTENHSIINGTIIFNNSKLVIEYYERIKTTSLDYKFRHYKGIYNKI